MMFHPLLPVMQCSAVLASKCPLFYIHRTICYGQINLNRTVVVRKSCKPLSPVHSQLCSRQPTKGLWMSHHPSLRFTLIRNIHPHLKGLPSSTFSRFNLRVIPATFIVAKNSFHSISSPHFQRASPSLPFEIKTDVEKDVILYKYENPRFFWWLSIFGMVQLFFWIYLAHFSMTTLRDAKPDIPKQDETTGQKTELPFWRRINLGENKYRYGMIILCSSVGYLIALASGMFTLRSIRYIILRKGGRTATLVTYAPFARSRFIDHVPLENLSCQHSRKEARVHMSLKIKGRWMYFLIDKSGSFLKPKLFDQTVGLSRPFK